MTSRTMPLTVVLLCGMGWACHPIPNALVGTWELISRVDRDSTGGPVVEPSLGSNPKGYLIYDATGHVAVQLMARDRSGSPCTVTAAAQANNLAHIGGYDAYFGRYEADQRTGTVTHILDGALSQSDIGRRLTRQYRLAGDTLTIWFWPGGTDHRITRTLVWHRVRE
jgi:Lipocalin-like domain